MSTVATLIALGIIAFALLCIGHIFGNYPEKVDYAIAFAVYAAIRANEDK